MRSLKNFLVLLYNQKGLEEPVKVSEFVFDSADLSYHECQKIRLNCGKSHMDSMKWLKNKQKNQQ